PCTCPSEYLCACCPVCFGGSSMLVKDLDAVVCKDTCFTQKHNKQKTHNPPKELPNVVFILENKIQAWEEFVASKRNIATRIKQCTSDIEEKDGFEGPLKVPNSVLNTCKKSFTAAD
ncbi:hypothetical protein GYMLUDRAFT_140897, partial [Collybiopsis luxurians FD-317 M1]